MSVPIRQGIYRFTCLRPDHVGVFDEHVSSVDYDILAAKRAILAAQLARARELLESAMDVLIDEWEPRYVDEVRDFLKELSRE